MRHPTDQEPALGRSARDCLKAVYELQVSNGRASTSAVAELLGVSDPSVTRMVKRLAKLGLLSYTPYHGSKLTPAGDNMARHVLHRRELIARYLIGFLSYPAGQADAEADSLECAVSPQFEARITALLRDSTEAL